MGLMSFRFNKQMQDELIQIQSELNTTKTEVLKHALHLLYSQVIPRKKKESLFDYLKTAGFIGGFDGDEDLSTNYKSIIDSEWGYKYE